MKKLSHGDLSKIIRYQSEGFSRLVDMEARYGICVRRSRKSNNFKNQLERKKRKRKNHHKENGEDNAGRPRKWKAVLITRTKALYVMPNAYGRHGPKPDRKDGNAELLSEVMTKLIQKTIAMEICVLAKTMAGLKPMAIKRLR